jgi:hypothetical protein
VRLLRSTHSTAEAERSPLFEEGRRKQQLPTYNHHTTHTHTHTGAHTHNTQARTHTHTGTPPHQHGKSVGEYNAWYLVLHASSSIDTNTGASRLWAYGAVFVARFEFASPFTRKSQAQRFLRRPRAHAHPVSLLPFRCAAVI